MRQSFASLLLFALWLCALHGGEPITPAAQKVIAAIESMEVEKYWLAGAIVDWQTGLPTGKPVTDAGKHTHCSQFVAAACAKLGVYILRPPEHSAVLLANAQFDWLGSDSGKKAGWSPSVSGSSAQDDANKGSLVVAVYKNSDEKKSGHIAIVRPGERTADQIAIDGPEVIQAGGTNFTKTTLRRGFSNHLKGYDSIRFYTHSAPTP